MSATLPEEQLSQIAILIKQNQALILKNQDSWLSDEGVAKRFGVSVSLITKWRKQFGLPFSQIGEVRRYSTKEVDDWFKGFSPQRILSKAS